MEKEYEQFVDEDGFSDDDIFRLTPEAIFKMILEDFGIEVNDTIARCIFNETVTQLKKNGYLEERSNGKG